jgi:hypothetical protein
MTGRKDFARLGEIARMAGEVAQRYRRLDRLVNESNDFTAISVDPGSDDPDVVRMHRWASTPTDHAADIITQLSSPTLAVRNGAFYEGLLPGVAAAVVEDVRALARLWRLSEARP